MQIELLEVVKENDIVSHHNSNNNHHASFES